MSTRRETRLFFPTILRECHIDKPAEFNKQIMKGVEKTRTSVPNMLPDTWSCDLYTTLGSKTKLLDQKEFKPLHDVIVEEMDEFARDLNLDIDNFPLRITDCWLNVYGEGNSQEVHNHANSVISGIYYAKAPKGSGALMIQSPYADNMFQAPTLTNDSLNMTQINLQPREGLMVLFRSYVKHAVKPNRITDERVSIAFNATMDVL